MNATSTSAAFTPLHVDCGNRLSTTSSVLLVRTLKRAEARAPFSAGGHSLELTFGAAFSRAGPSLVRTAS